MLAMLALYLPGILRFDRGVVCESLADSMSGVKHRSGARVLGDTVLIRVSSVSWMIQ